MTFDRQLGIVTPKELDFPILLIGAGGIGSWTALALIKIGCSNLTVVDHDTVGEENIPSQFYKPEQIGQPKAEALAQNIKELTGTEITPIVSKVNMGPHFFDVIISAVDSMETRKDIWNSLVHHTFPYLYIDGRMGGEVIRIISTNCENDEHVEKYHASITNAQPTDDEPCTERAICYNTFVCGGLISSLVKKYAKKEYVPRLLTFDIKAYQMC